MTRLRTGLVLATATTVGVTLCGALLSQSAQAAFALSPCAGASVVGRGSSYEGAAIAAWTIAYKTQCGPSAASVIYDPAGSGAGRGALGEKGTTNATQLRDPLIRFAGTDDAPTAAQRAQAETGAIDSNGADITTADNDGLHVIPAAAGAVAVVVNWPRQADSTPCPFLGLSPATAITAGSDDRPQLDQATVEKAFAGDPAVDTWGELYLAALTSLNSSTAATVYALLPQVCKDAPIKRVVRQDSSGTTTALKRWLTLVNGSRGWSSLGNTAWPNDGTDPVVRPTATGAAPELTTAAATGGSIAYSDLGSARTGGATYAGKPVTAAASNDTFFWIKAEAGSSTTFADPQSDAAGWQDGATARGAACGDITPTSVPANTRGDWSATSAARLSGGYPLCTVTYLEAFDDNAVVYCRSDAEQAMARTEKDFLTAALSVAGQASLAANDYAPLPTPLVTIAQAGIASIDWDKNGEGRACASVTPSPSPSTSPSPSLSPSPIATLVPLVSTFSVSTKPKGSSSKITLALSLPGTGSVIVKVTAKHKGKTYSVAKTTTTTIRAKGKKSFSFTLTPTVKKYLATANASVTITISYTPKDGTRKGTTKTTTLHLTLKKVVKKP